MRSAVQILIMPTPLERLEIEIDRADESEIVGMCSIFWDAFQIENPRLAQVMYAGHYADSALSPVLRTNLNSKYSKYMIAFDCRRKFKEDMSYGWISVGIVLDGNRLSSYEANDLAVYVSWTMLTTEARSRGEDPLQLTISDPRAHLVDALSNRSQDGQFTFVPGPHLVVNGLFMWPDSHEDSIWEMAFKLLGWAVECAKRKNWPIWSQVLVGQRRFFRQAGFMEVSRFALNLNDYTHSSGTNWGTQEWVQMVYTPPPERRARSRSPDLREGRGRRPSV